MSILIGIVCCIGAAIFFFTESKVSGGRFTPIQSGLILIGVGLVLIMPYRRLFRSRSGPFVLVLTLLVPVSYAYSVGFGWWEVYSHGFQPLILVWTLLWLIFCANFEYARRRFLEAIRR